MSAFPLTEHQDCKVDMQETSSTIWSITINGNEVRAFDYTTGDGAGDYVLYCHDHMITGELPDEADLDFI